MLSVDINKDVGEYKSNFFMGFSLKQCVSVLVSAALCIGTVVLFQDKIGLTASCYLSMPLAAPVCLNAFYNKNGMNFTEYVKKTWKSLMQKPLLYVSEERPKE